MPSAMRLNHFFMQTSNRCRQIKAITIEPEYYNRTGMFFCFKNRFTSPAA
jgi:hypothetical protein